MSPSADPNGAHSGSAGEPAWQTAMFGLLHPVKVMVVEAHLWVDEPLSATLLVEVFDDTVQLNNLAYHVRKLAEAGVLQEAFTLPRRGAIEHFYRLAIRPADLT